MKNKFFVLSVIFILVFNFAVAEELAQEIKYPPSDTGNLGATSLNTRITLDVKGMDIVDLLKMLATRAGINIVVGKNVTGRVTLFLKDVDILDAFEIILLSNDLAYDKKGDIINVITQRDYELFYGKRYQDKRQAKSIQLKYAKALNLATSLNQIKSSIGRVVADDASNMLFIIDTADKIKEMEAFIASADIPLKTEVFSLNYSQADKLSQKLQEAITKGVGSIKIDERTNKIAVTDYPQKLEEIAKIIEAFDAKTPQVLIDAQIIEFKPSDKLEMGFNVDYWINKYFDIKATLPLNSVNSIFFGTTHAPAGEKYILDILRTIGDTKILSSPRIMTINNQEARILVGTKDAYITSTTSMGASGTTVTAQSVNFVDVGIKLYVTATVNNDNFVTMKIRPEISSATRTKILSEDTETDIPIVTTSEAETNVIVKDGITIIIGGLRKDERIKTTKRLPILGDIPLLGYFFGSTSDELKKTELIILLTPHIMSGEKSYIDFNEIKPKIGAVANMNTKGNIEIERISGDTDSANYYKTITDKVRALALFDTASEQKGEVVIVFALSKEGSLIGEPTIVKTDNPNLDKFAIRAVKEASPFPPFPASMGQVQEKFKINLSYR